MTSDVRIPYPTAAPRIRPGLKRIRHSTFVIPSCLGTSSFVIPCPPSSPMSVQLTVEERLTAVEQELAALKRRLPSERDRNSWIEQIAGTFKDDPDFEEIVRLGREFRKSVP